MVTRRIEESQRGSSTRATTSSHGSSSSSSIQTPIVTPSVSEHEDMDPDSPIPSIESVTPSEASVTTDSGPSTPTYTPSTVSLASEGPHNSVRHGSLDQHLQNLRLDSVTPQPRDNSPRDLRLQRELSSASSTPSIRVTPTPSSSRNERADSLVNGLNALDMRSASPSDRVPIFDQLLGAQQSSTGDDARPSSRSPSPLSRPRRSSALPEPIKHKVENEEPPRSLFHTRGIQTALATARQLSGIMADALSKSYLHQEQGSNVRSLYQQATHLRDFKLPTSRIVGLVGDSGVGKSRLINSLLDKEDFASASSAKGAACTCVVTEYHSHDRNDFIIEVDYFAINELRAQFKQLLQAYRAHQAANTPEDMPPNDREDLEKRANLAKHTFNACFKADLHDGSGILSVLPFDDAIDTLMDWTKQIMSEHIGDEGVSISTEIFDNAVECSNRLHFLTSEAEGGRRCLWPFIRKVKVFLRAHILSKGLIIADLPGLRDLNSARQNVTERYVRQCHLVFAVAEMDRPTTNPGIRDVFELASRASLANVGIVCTKSDLIKADEAKKDWPKERERIEQWQSAIARDEYDQNVLQAEIRECLSHQESFADLVELQQSLFQVQATCKRAKFELQEHIISIRNRKVADELRRLYRNGPNNKSPDIFCTSSEIYWDNRYKPVEEGLPYLNLSNIIALRRHCVGIVVDSHLRATIEYIRDEIPALLGSVQLWIQAGSGNANAERKERVLDILQDVQSQLDRLTFADSEMDELSETLKDVFENQITSLMRSHCQKWSTSAGRASRRWNSYHHSSYAAFCRNYGDYETRAIGRRCWNAEAIKLMEKDISSQWDMFYENVESQLQSLSKSTKEVFANILNTTRPQDNGIRRELSALRANLRRRRGLILHGIDNADGDFQRKLERVYTDAVAPVQTAIIGELMQESYDDASMESGSGSDSRRKAIISSAFASSTLFNDHRRQFRKRFEIIADKLQKRISKIVAAQISAIEGDLDTLRDNNVVLESERNPQFRRNLDTTLDRVRREMRAIQRTVDDAVGAAREDTPMDD